MGNLIRKPPIEELLKLNEVINRRLFARVGKKKPYIVDSTGRRIDAQPVGKPESMKVSDFQGFDTYRVHLWEPVDWEGDLTKAEISLMLGRDYDSRAHDKHLQISIEASCSKLDNYDVNAYVTGVDREAKEPCTLIVSVQHYKITKRDYKRLGIRSNPDLMEAYIRSVKINRGEK